jgi:large subunit ribosomal protein L6
MFSRIGASSIKIDSKYKINLDGDLLKISLNNKVYDYQIDKKLSCELDSQDSSLRFVPNLEKIRNKSDQRKVKKIAGFHVRDLQNLLTGLSTPFKANIDIIGTGYKVVYNKQMNMLTFSLGYSHDIIVSVPSDIVVEVNQNKLALSSFSKKMLGAFSSYLCLSLRKFDKFKGKGVILVGKYMQRKELKKK